MATALTFEEFVGDDPATLEAIERGELTQEQLVHEYQQHLRATQQAQQVQADQRISDARARNPSFDQDPALSERVFGPDVANRLRRDSFLQNLQAELSAGRLPPVPQGTPESTREEPLDFEFEPVDVDPRRREFLAAMDQRNIAEDVALDTANRRAEFGEVLRQRDRRNLFLDAFERNQGN